ncbi:MAG: hypothetical protein EOP40_18725 [Rubrivivax sp.]|nr:MAG: hypothetical protein EOP40_18725 [Rubrivivax sp.]
MSALVLCHWGGGLAAAGVAVIALCLWRPSPMAWIVGMLVYSTGHGVIFPSSLSVVMQALPTRAGMAASFAGMVQMMVGAAVSGAAALLPGSATERTVAVAATMVAAGVLALLAARDSAAMAGVAQEVGS